MLYSRIKFTSTATVWYGISLFFYIDTDDSFFYQFHVPKERTVTDKGTTVEETVHHHIHHVIQPVIDKESKFCVFLILPSLFYNLTTM